MTSDATTSERRLRRQITVANSCQSYNRPIDAYGNARETICCAFNDVHQGADDNKEEHYREAARYVDKILRGGRPGDLPVRYPGRYFLTINKGAAQGLSLVLPQALVEKADRVMP